MSDFNDGGRSVDFGGESDLFSRFRDENRINNVGVADEAGQELKPCRNCIRPERKEGWNWQDCRNLCPEVPAGAERRG